MRTLRGLTMPFLLIFLLTAFAFAQERELRTSVERMAELEEAIRSLNDPECVDDHRAFSKVVSGIPVACASSHPRDGYDEVSIIDCTRDGKTYPGGFRFRSQNGHPLIPGRSPYSDGGPPGRLIELLSRDHALNETYLYLSDTAGGPDSHDVKSAMFILPRRVIPSVKVVGNDVEVTMTTGEKVVFDKRTNAIKSGALREGQLDTTTDRFRRQPPNVHYNGTGISVRLNHRFEDPLQSSETAEIKQGGRTCSVPRSTLFDDRGKLKTTSDTQLVRVLNHNCPVRPGQSPFRI